MVSFMKCDGHGGYDSITMRTPIVATKVGPTKIKAMKLKTYNMFLFSRTNKMLGSLVEHSKYSTIDVARLCHATGAGFGFYCGISIFVRESRKVASSNVSRTSRKLFGSEKPFQKP